MRSRDGCVYSPRVYRKGDQSFVLEMNLAHDVVQQGLARPVGTHLEWLHLHAANAAQGRA